MDEPHTLNERAEKIASNTILLALARLSMVAALPVLGMIATLGASYLDQKFEAANSKIEAQRLMSEQETRLQVARVERIEKTATDAMANSTKINDRLISVETKQNTDAITQERFQTAVLDRVDRMQDSIVVLSNSIASLTATITAQDRYQKGARNGSDNPNGG